MTETPGTSFAPVEQSAEMDTARTRWMLPVSVLFFLSGMTSLIYEVLWVREFGLVFGVTTYAVSTVLAAFFTGLAVGSYVAGRIIDRGRWHPLVVYGVMEGIIGVYALLMPVLLRLVEASYPAVYASLGGSFTLFTLFRFIICFALLAVPTTLMGATLPVLSKLFVQHESVLGMSVGKLYAINTFGAVAGAVLSGFFLVAALGVPGALWTAAVGNFILCAAALALSRLQELRGTQPAAVSDQAPTAVSAGAGRPRLILLLTFLCGAAVLAMEVVWTRSLILILGSTTYAFATMLTAVLVGIALGSAVFSRYADPAATSTQDGSRLILAGALLFVAGVCAALGPAVINRLPFLFLRLTDRAQGDFRLVVAAQFVVCFALVFIPTFLSGASFPILVRLYSRGAGAVGRTVADVYSVNTLGGIVGSLLGGFVLVKFLGLQPALTTSALALMLAGVVAVAAARTRRPGLRAVTAGAMVIACLAFAITPPRFNTKILFGGWGPFAGGYNQGGTSGTTVDVTERAMMWLRYHREGMTASVDVVEGPTGMRLISINAQPVATTYLYDMRALKMLGHLPVLLHPDPKDVLIIGLGAGVSSGTIARYPAVRDVTVVELSEEVPGGTALFADWNHDALNNPKLHLVINDGANYVKATRRQYDIISSDPIHPFLLGNGILYSYEHWMICRDHLRPGGVLAQWLPLYQLSTSDFATVIGTFVDAFPNATMWFSGIDVVLIGTKDDTTIDVASIARHMADPAMAADLATMGIVRPDDLLGWLAAGPEQLRRMASGARRNRVDYPVLEYTAPRALSCRGVAETMTPILSAVAQLPDSRLTALLEGMLTRPLDEVELAGVLRHRKAQHWLMQGLLANSDDNNDQYVRCAQSAQRLRSEDRFQREALCEALIYQAAAQRWAGDSRTALATYRRAIAADPERVDALVGGVETAIDLDDTATADAMLRVASPSQMATFQCRVLAGISALMKRDYRTSRRLVQRAMANGQESPAAHLTLGICDLAARRADSGRERFDRALRIATSREQCLSDIVRTCTWHGFRDTAREYAPELLREASRWVDEQPSVATHYRHRAIAYRALSEHTRAESDEATARRLTGE